MFHSNPQLISKNLFHRSHISKCHTPHLNKHVFLPDRGRKCPVCFDILKHSGDRSDTCNGKLWGKRDSYLATLQLFMYRSHMTGRALLSRSTSQNSELHFLQNPSTRKAYIVKDTEARKPSGSNWYFTAQDSKIHSCFRGQGPTSIP